MRTTIILDPDIAARLKGLRKRRDQTLKEIVNTALRAGLDWLESLVKRSSKPYRIRPRSLGARLPNLDNIADVLDRHESKSL